MERKLKRERKMETKSRIENPSSVDSNRVWISLERKYNVAAYETFTVQVGGSVSLDPLETVREGVRRLYNEIREEFDDIKEVMRKEETR